MGVCKVTETLLSKFRWAVRIPGDEHHVKCRYDGRILSVKKGCGSLEQHQTYVVHVTSEAVHSGNQVTIEIANARATTVATSVRKATILHVLNLVLNKHSFRSSDSANSKRAIYAKMFPDSAATSINCGKTKAMYHAVHGLAPYAKRKLALDASNKLFGLHVDETSYNEKNRLEFWFGFIGDRIRKSKYLTTIEIETKLDIEAFIKSGSSVKSIDDIKLVDSESVFNATVAALQQHNLDLCIGPM